LAGFGDFSGQFDWKIIENLVKTAIHQYSTFEFDWIFGYFLAK